MKSEKELYEYWKNYIDIPIYRVIPIRTQKEALSRGIDPKNNPYKKIIPKIKSVFNLIKRLEKRGIHIIYLRGKSEVTAHFICQELLTDLSKNYIDFCISQKHIDYYLSAIPGGGVPNAVKKLTKELIGKDLPIPKKEKQIIRKLKNWADSLICKNTVVYVMGSSSVFERALFQLMGTKKKKHRTKFKESKYLPSPFGCFKHFKKIIKEQGLQKYAYRLRNKKYYLRVQDKISPKEIKLIKLGEIRQKSNLKL
jgi:hypothetical protein